MKTLQQDDGTGSGDDQLLNEAIDWLICLNESRHEPDNPYADAATRNQAFFAWLKQSERHLQVFLEALDLECRIRNLNRHSIDDVRRLAEMHIASAAEIRPTDEFSEGLHFLSSTKPQKEFRRAKIVGAALVVAVGAVISIFFLGSRNATATPRTYTTRVGEVRVEKLDDGTTMILNTDSQVEVSFSRSTRDVHLTRGESYFDVSEDAQRSFNVMVDDTCVSALATEFAVRKAPEGVDVTVESGRVFATSRSESGELPARAVAASRLTTGDDSGGSELLHGGEKAIISSGQMRRVSGVNVEEELAWSMLVFRDKQLSYVAEQFNRYNKPKLRIEGDLARDTLVTGAYKVHRYRDIVKFARTKPNLLVMQVGDDYVIKSNK